MTMTQNELDATLKAIGLQRAEVDANWDGQNPDLMTPAEVAAKVASVVELSKTVDTFAMNIVSLLSHKLSNESDVAPAVRALFATSSAPETDSASLYWGLMALYNAARRRGVLYQAESR